MEAAAVNILKRAVDMDEKRRFTEAMICYQEGIQLLIDYIKKLNDAEKRQHFRSRIESYMTRAEVLKKHIEEEKNKGSYHEQTLIEHDSIGHSYESVFGRFFDSEVTSVNVEDPYIRSYHQRQNLLRFCELAVKKCPSLSSIKLMTSENPSNDGDQSLWLNQLKAELISSHNINLSIKFSSTLHDRQIKLSNGWIIKIGRGLDYFKAPETKYSLGYYDLDLRPCHETTVDVFHQNDVLTKHS